MASDEGEWVINLTSPSKWYNNPINLRSKQNLICQVLMMQEDCETTHYILKKEN